MTSANEVDKDIAAQPGESWEWFYIGDKRVKRSLFVVNHADDTYNDLFKDFSAMAVLALGRAMNTTEYISVVPHKFSFGFADDTTYDRVRTAIHSAVAQSTSVFTNRQNGRSFSPVPPTDLSAIRPWVYSCSGRKVILAPADKRQNRTGLTARAICVGRSPHAGFALVGNQ